MGPDPRAIADALNAWALRTDWVDWVELGGSLGRGAGDALSDVDAGIGVRDLAADASDARDPDGPDPDWPDTGAGDLGERGSGARDPRLDAIRSAITGFAPTAAVLDQRLGDLTHLICVYRDGRQLSLVVFDAAARTGLPPQSSAPVDKTGRLAEPLAPDRWDPDDRTRREWAFLAWIALGDAARHTLRDHPWRALHALTEARDHLWRLHAAALGLTYPAFGAVTVENAEAEPPQGIHATHPETLTAPDMRKALEALAGLLGPHTTGDLEPLAAVIRERLALAARYRA
ncbi:hypothetical protein [Glycomyces albidus]|uniref:Nucleotidyltransferase domain-containing protein n=1 Tax=Glycomyces albidus TaxID=2656774 RepID=A0A6L5GBP9_9ACTN|nr:hypothetical protein [Glycomyces albidus]MQM27107.1 hypothetical protein [Glycomyces albidus]